MVNCWSVEQLCAMVNSFIKSRSTVGFGTRRHTVYSSVYL